MIIQTYINFDTTESNQAGELEHSRLSLKSKSETEFKVHERENNAESEINLESNRERFQGQCKKLYDYLMSGGRCNGDQAKELFGIRHLPRRKKDLTDQGFKISDEWVGKMKDIFMSNEDIEYNNQQVRLKI